MRALRRLLAALALLLAPAAARAIRVPLPIEGATMNISVIVQSQAMLTEAGTPDGTGWATDIFARRTRLLVNGDINQNWSYYFQTDNANFGKFGNYTLRMIVQDAFASWAPTGSTGGTVLFVDGGLMFFPFTREVMTSIGNKATVEGHVDLYRGFPAGFFPASRSLGLQLRGWALDKKIGFRGGIFEGQRASAGSATTLAVNPKSNPAFAGLVTLHILGTQEGSYVYQAIYFSKDPLLSITISGAYQAQALVVPKGLTDQKMAGAQLFFEYPFSEDVEVIAGLWGYGYGNGSGSRDTGKAWAADLAFRYKSIKPYASIEQFTSDDCPSDLVGAALTTCQTLLVGAVATGAHSADTRNFRGGLDLLFNRTANHLIIEFSVNHGQSGFGPQSITAAAAGYVPLSIDPATAGGPRQAINTTLAAPAFKSVLLNWYATF
ncbi:MAG: hypothetical protein E6J78_12715 [Deltaproteobacteria bacterium]|nr:MAG: hypothetical protein E6J78_12715 [Deltaproteobacteria bacterium]